MVLLVILIVTVFVSLWVACEVSEAIAINRALRKAEPKNKETMWKITVGFFIMLERWVYRHSGIKLPMYRRMVYKRAKETQRLLNQEHGTNIAYPDPQQRRWWMASV